MSARCLGKRRVASYLVAVSFTCRCCGCDVVQFLRLLVARGSMCVLFSFVSFRPLFVAFALLVSLRPIVAFACAACVLFPGAAIRSASTKMTCIYVVVDRKVRVRKFI